jgi:hypothetical protein
MATKCDYDRFEVRHKIDLLNMIATEKSMGERLNLNQLARNCKSAGGTFDLVEDHG